MRFSTRTRYGLRAMLEIARAHGQGPISVKEIAQRQELPEHYLEQVVAPLRKAGLLHSLRGAQGGYALSRPACDVTLLEIVGALDGALDIAPCACAPGQPHSGGFCMEHAVWRRLKQHVDAYLADVRLQDLVDEAQHVAAGLAPMYHI